VVQIANCILRLFSIALNELQMGRRNYKGAVWRVGYIDRV